MSQLYHKELEALQRANRLRTRSVVDERLKDFASNDYLGLAHLEELHNKTAHYLAQQKTHAPKASMLVNGYHQIHKDFEIALATANGFEEGIVFGSGFNANIALIEALTRKNDCVFMDEKYHASGVLGTQLNGINVVFFRHNDMNHLKELLHESTAQRKIIAVEGIYSMDGDLCPKEVFTIAQEEENRLLIVDEAHSSGVVGEHLMGVFDLYNIPIKPNVIKMGTLGKAYGSFGAYILASSHIVTYLLNRAKPLIYATALSLYDTKRAHYALEYILDNATALKAMIQKRQKIVYELLGADVPGLIVPLRVGDNRAVMNIKEDLSSQGFSVGAIRQPTVDVAIIRFIARLGESEEDCMKLCTLVKKGVACYV